MNSSLSPEQFAKHKARANRIGKSIMVNKVWITPDKGVEAKKKAAVREWHASLAPMKSTISKAGVSWPELRNHIRNNSDALGSPRGKDSGITWARDLHDKDPENFLKNIGLA